MRLKLGIALVFAALLSVVGVCDVNAQSSGTVEQCTAGRQAAATGFWTWAPQARVQVYIRSADFESDQMSSLLTALKNWNNTSEETGSGVKFEYHGNAEQQRVCENCLTILRNPVFNKNTRHPMELSAYSAADNRIITTATIFVDPVLTNPGALLNALVHELGHNLGLLDCYSCKPKSTVMNQFKALNQSNQIEKPTSCDIAQVRRVYKEVKELAKAIAASRKPVLVDEGEEPVDDDTPIVVPASTRPPAGNGPAAKPGSRQQ